ncbi:putative transcriptional regulator [Sphaerochaeta pleomorpha str. Grapes]|uniref:Putative transcriptional regulator n=1 Tax=Sphaerochaeta pleomorpha (strain ATCC BAA-1885 / DSM 22778 / Grapes) TaxID=158190 RepID=G8QRH3_SPHPG|nr:helix-turn-helix transcriptional regulator [Sphaerochaeta pleomorpha]AEV29895.1 putative transcriptional regulator [Sphaerochaeta pleomorpha str. Grapes]
MQKFWDRVITLLDSPSVVELSKSLGVNRSTLSSWIHNDRRPPMLIAMKISELTGVSLSKLENGFDWDYSDEDDEEEEDEVAEETSPLLAFVLKNIKTLDTEQLEFVRTVVEYLKNHPSTTPQR